VADNIWSYAEIRSVIDFNIRLDVGSICDIVADNIRNDVDKTGEIFADNI
jgi:hypothetical protein